MIRDKKVFGISERSLKERMLREANLTLEKAVNLCHAAEASKVHLKTMVGGAGEKASVNVINKNRVGKPSPYKQKSTNKSCVYCGLDHKPRKCPAFGQKCRKCGKLNHFAQVCRSSAQRRVHTLEESDSDQFEYEDDEEYNLLIEELFVGNIESSKWQAKVTLEGKEVSFKLDTGAQANVIPHYIYKTVGEDGDIKKTSAVLSPYGKGQIKPMGKVLMKCEVPSTKKRLKLPFYVTREPYNAILGQDACEELNLVKRVEIDEVTESMTKEEMLEEYKDLFEGLGSFEREYNIEVNQEVPSVIQPARRFPYTRLDRLKATLEKMERQEIIAPVDRPTEWVSNLTVVEKKNGTLRVCLDPKPLNEAIRRERHSIPLPEDVQHKLNGKTVFTILDERSGFWQVKLTEESSYLTTFNSPWGLKRFLRMPFGICSASEVMQKRNEETFGDLQDVHVIADDMIIAGKDDEEHDQRLRKVMARARERNVKFNPDKVQFKVPTVIYMGTEISKDGMRPDPRKVEAITKMPKPENKQDLRRLLGMVKFVSRFIPNESAVTAPLRTLLKEEVEYQWQNEHDRAFETLKEILSTRPVLRFYDVTAPVTLQSDASQSGLGACLMQDGQPVAYASRALTIAEKNYSQVEKELLSVVFACEKFHQYVFGKDIAVQNDHKPLLGILKKPLAQASPRLQRLQMKLSGYRIHLEWIQGTKMLISDALSRAPVGMAEQCLQDDEVLIHALVESLPISGMKIEEMRDAMNRDEALQVLKTTVQKGWPKYKDSTPLCIRQYWQFRDEINVREGIVFRGDRMVVPAVLRKEMLGIIHESHMGVEKSKARANQVIYWPGMSREIQEKVERCTI